MFEPKNLVPRADGSFLDPRTSHPLSKQRRMMAFALVLLLSVLGFILYNERDFWFPDTDEAENQSPQDVPATSGASHKHAPARHKKLSPHTAQPADSALAAASSAPSAATTGSKTEPPATRTRRELAPLEVEVIAPDYHRILHPNTSSVFDLQNQPPRKEVPAKTATSDHNEVAANVTTNAAERVQVSANTANEVTHSVKPGYPLLARKMKVQGAVILQAQIGRSGLIEDLHVLSGPPILADAAQEAVKQWHFKPHYEGAQAVATQAKITVNFTISTN